MDERILARFRTLTGLASNLEVRCLATHAPVTRALHLTCPVSGSRVQDTIGGPDPKEIRWSPKFFGATGRDNRRNGRDSLANHGYGPQSSLCQGPSMILLPTDSVATSEFGEAVEVISLLIVIVIRLTDSGQLSWFRCL